MIGIEYLFSVIVLDRVGFEDSHRLTERVLNSMKSGAVIKRIMQISPIVMVVVMGIIYLTCLRGISVSQILEYTPENTAAAVIVILFMFALKSMSYFFPMFILYAVSGSVFPMWLALTVNLAGTVILATLPYLIGRFAERDLVEKIISKSGQADKIRRMRDDNRFFMCFFLRVISCLPCDIVSLSLGSAGIEYPVYLAGSVLGIMPGMVCTTLIGDSVTDPKSPQFIIAICVNFSAALISIAVHKFLKKKKEKGKDVV